MRLLPVFATAVVLVMAAATIWIVTGSPDQVGEVEPTAVAPKPTPEASPVVVAVERGAGVQEIAEALEDRGVIDSAIQFRVLVSLLGYERMLRAGEYELDEGMPALEVIYRMRRGLTTPHFVTVVEGRRLEEIADALDAQAVIQRQEFLDAAIARNFDFDFLKRLGPETPLEGYLFPATYFYSRTDSAEDLFQQMLETMDRQFSRELRDRARENGLTMHGVLTLASIVEREARVPEERPIIAQVFLRRLQIGMRLDADPTVQYALAADPESVEEFGYWKTALTAEDLEVKSEYNTYREFGLPPTPIAAPRLESIVAVIEPAQTRYLYFVAKPDGSHAFAETLDEHLENVEEFAR